MQTERILNYMAEHAQHGGFRAGGNPWRRTLGFACNCSGAYEWVTEFPLRDWKDLRSRHREVWELYEQMRRTRPLPDDVPLGPEAQARQDQMVEAQKDHEKRLEAEKKAEALLLRYLRPDQATTYQAEGYFDVEGGDGRGYRVRKYSGPNVDLIEKGEVVATYCIYPIGGVPVGDKLLAQKLFLEADPASFFRVALKHPPQRRTEGEAD
jgi:hypothetical protein